MELFGTAAAYRMSPTRSLVLFRNHHRKRIRFQRSENMLLIRRVRDVVARIEFDRRGGQADQRPARSGTPGSEKISMSLTNAP